ERVGALTALGRPRPSPRGGGDGGDEATHAQTTRDSTTATRPGALRARDRAELSPVREYGERLPGTGDGRDADVALTRGARRRRGAHPAALPRRGPPGLPASRAGLGGDPSRAAPPARDEATPLAGISAAAPRRLPVQPILRALRRVGGDGVGHDAPDPSCRREVLRRF